MWIAAGLGGCAAGLGAWAWRRRVVLGASLTRGAWWAALAAWWTAAVGLLGGGVLDVEHSLVVFAVGTGVCAAVVAFGGVPRVRWLGGALGSLHGASAVVLWFVVSA